MLLFITSIARKACGISFIGDSLVKEQQITSALFKLLLLRIVLKADFFQLLFQGFDIQIVLLAKLF